MSMPPTGSPYPPQLHLSIPPSTTSFKRSFEQFGFDLDDSPIPGNNGGSNPLHQASGSNGGGGGSGHRAGPSVGAFGMSSSGRDNNRNKRQRSASTETNSSSGRSSRSNYHSVSSGSSSMHRLSARPSLEVPPRLPTPDVDVDMSDVNDAARASPTSAPNAAPLAVPSAPINFPEVYRTAFQGMHGETSPTSPPVLPPLRLGMDHEEEPFMESQEQSLAVNGDEPPRIHIDLPQAPLTIGENEDEGSEAAIILPDPPTLPPIPTVDLFEPAPQTLSDHVPPSPSLHELRQWIDEAASPPADTRPGVADQGSVTSRVVLAAPSTLSASPTNADGERSSPTRTRLQRSLGDFLSVAVESDGDSPISTLFPRRREEPSRRELDETGGRLRTSEGQSAVTSSYTPSPYSSLYPRRHIALRGGDRNEINSNSESLPSTATRDATRSGPRTQSTTSLSGQGSRSTSSNILGWSSRGRRSTQPTWVMEPPTFDLDSSSDDELETSILGPAQHVHGSFAFSSSMRRALLERRLPSSSSLAGASTEGTTTSVPQPFSTHLPRQVSLRPSSSSLVAENPSDVRARELDRFGIGLTGSTSTPYTTRPSEHQGAGTRSYPFTGSGAPIFDAWPPRIQSSAAAQSPTLPMFEGIASRMDFDRSAGHNTDRAPTATAPPSQTSASSTVPTFYPTTLPDRAYHHTLSSDLELRSVPRSSAPAPPYLSTALSTFFDDMSTSHHSGNNGDASPIFEPASSRNPPHQTGASRTTFIPPAIPSPSLDLSFSTDLSVQSHSSRAPSGPGSGQEIAPPAPNPTDPWLSFPDFPFALEVFTNELAHVPPSPRIDPPNPPPAPRYASGGFLAQPPPHSGPAATNSVFSRGAQLASRLPADSEGTNSLWEMGTRERSTQDAEPRNDRYLYSPREREERERRRRAEETQSYRSGNLGAAGGPFRGGTSAQPSGSYASAASSAPLASSGSAPVSRVPPASTVNSSNRTDTSEGVIANRFIPGPFSNTMRVLERDRNNAARALQHQHNLSETNASPARPENAISSPERTNTSTSTPSRHSHVPVPTPVPGPPSSSGPTGSMAFHRQRPTSVTGPPEPRSTYRSTQREPDDVPPSVRPATTTHTAYERLLQVQPSSTRTIPPPPPPEPRRRDHYVRYLDGTSHPPPPLRTATASRRESLLSSGPVNPFRPPVVSRTTGEPATVTTPSARTQASYTEDNTRPFAQAIESLREPRQGPGTASTASTTRARARAELTEENRAMNRERARVRAEFASRRRHTLNLRGFSMGDFMRDDEFDESYEALLTLSSTVGEARPRGTPGAVLETMEKGKYEDWATPETDKRCPICLDDYCSSDKVMKLKNCSHWLHQECLEQWLKCANTCPVCRNQVHGASSSPSLSSSATARRSYLPTRFSRESRLLDRTSNTNNLPGSSNSSNTSNTSSGGRNSLNNGGRNTMSSSPPTSSRTGRSSPLSHSRLAATFFTFRRARDNDDDAGFGPSGSGGTSSSSSSTSSFGSPYSF